MRWAGEDDRILAVALCGTHARGTPRTGSDIDLIVIADSPDELLGETGWMQYFGNVVSIGREDYGLVQSLRTFYDNGSEIEFGLTNASWCTPPIDAGTARVMRSGIVPLYDPLGRLRVGIDWIEARSLNSHHGDEPRRTSS